MDKRPNTDEIRDLRMQLLAIEHQFKVALNGVSRALQTLAAWEDHTAAPAVGLPQTLAQNAVAIQRTRGGRSKVHKIDADPDLRAFVEARILTKTHDQIVADVAVNFPPERHVTRSSVSRWWSKQATLRRSKSQETG